ncbi:MAG TPA: RdgB/HAM1 family non-canonical purine NTP pyrophosphatase [Lysobacter sp.]
MNTLVLASGNRGKLAEFRALLAGSGVDCVPQQELGVGDIEETGLTFVENALLKARHAARVTGLPALADDSGLCVDALGGAPGVYSARFAAMEQGGEKSDAANNELLVRRLQGRADRRACYVALLVYVRHADDPRPVIVEGVWEGEIVDQPQGEHGFGYDPHFYIPQFRQTVAQLNPEIKNRHSHRGQALQSLLARLERE